MEAPKRLLAINRECDRKNKVYNIIGWSEEEIQTKKESFPTRDWVVILRHD